MFWREVTSVSRSSRVDDQVLVRNGDSGEAETVMLDTAFAAVPDPFWARGNRLVTNGRL
jgi:hypothetical protein